MTLPSPISVLVMKGMWTELVLLGRWLRQSVLLPHGHIHQVCHWQHPIGWFQAWPDFHWISDTMNRALEDFSEGVTVTVDTLRKAEQVFQQCVPLVLAAQENQESKQTLENELTEAMSTLCVAHGGLKPKLRHVRHTGIALLAALDVSVLLRSNGAGLRDVCEKALAALDPSLKTLIGQRLLTLPSSRTIRRHLLTLDVATVLFTSVHQKKSAPLARYGWADSSPLGGYDWLWIKHMEIKGADDKKGSLGQLLLKFQEALRLIQHYGDEGC